MLGMPTSCSWRRYPRSLLDRPCPRILNLWSRYSLYPADNDRIPQATTAAHLPISSASFLASSAFLADALLAPITFATTVTNVPKVTRVAPTICVGV